MEAIPNVYDGPVKPRQPPKQFELDFANSTDPHVIDKGIHEAIKGIKVSILAISIALYRMDVGGSYVDLGCRSFREYARRLSADTGMSLGAFNYYKYIGQAYIKHRIELESVGFSEEDGPTKLPYLDRALANRPKKEVYKNIVSMSKNDFDRWSKGPSKEPELIDAVQVEVKDDILLAGDKPLATFSPDVASDDRKYYEGILLAAAKAHKNGDLLGTFQVYDESELHAMQRVINRELKNLRASK
jgi:hypothetical protein